MPVDNRFKIITKKIVSMKCQKRFEKILICFIYFRADEIKMLNDDSDLASVRVYLTPIGMVFWLAPASFVAQCTINIQYYPFDSQECKIVVSYNISVFFMNS